MDGLSDFHIGNRNFEVRMMLYVNLFIARIINK